MGQVHVRRTDKGQDVATVPREKPPRRALLLQRKLAVGSADDPAERQADLVAEQVIARLKQGTGEPETVRRSAGRIRPLAHTAVNHGPEGGPMDPGVQQRIQARRGGGSPLPNHARSRLEDAFGAELSGIRIHTGSGADQLNRSLNARAFTAGSDIFFANGAYVPGSTEGDRLLAHEITHSVQQGAASVSRIRRAVDRGPVAEKGKTVEIGRLKGTPEAQIQRTFMGKLLQEYQNMDDFKARDKLKEVLGEPKLSFSELKHLRTEKGGNLSTVEECKQALVGFRKEVSEKASTRRVATLDIHQGQYVRSNANIPLLYRATGQKPEKIKAKGGFSLKLPGQRAQNLAMLVQDPLLLKRSQIENGSNVGLVALAKNSGCGGYAAGRFRYQVVFPVALYCFTPTDARFPIIYTTASDLNQIPQAPIVGIDLQVATEEVSFFQDIPYSQIPRVERPISGGHAAPETLNWASIVASVE